jgi:hypothetical protein
MNTSDPLWQHGTCDRIMTTLQKWIRTYRNGKISATCKRNSKPGPQGIQIEEVTRRYACQVAWKEADLDYFIKILEAKIPTSSPAYQIPRDWRRDFPKWKYGRLIQDGLHIVVMDVYFEDLVGLYKLMEALRDGKLQEKPDLTTIDLSAFK